MNDDEFAGIVGAALRERFPLPAMVDLQPQWMMPARRSRLRPMLAIAATVLVVAAVAFVVDLRATSKHTPSASTYGLDGLTWVGAGSTATLVFTDDAVRISDGCQNALWRVTIGSGWLRIGERIGRSSVCGGGPPAPAVLRFDRIVFSRGELNWQRDGDTLELTNASGDTVELHATGAALSVIGQDWGLSRYDSRGYSHPGNFGATLRIDQSGTVYATDLCRAVTGTAIVSDTTIAFADMRVGEGACADQESAATADVVDHVLTGAVDFAITGDELIIYGANDDLLIYIPAS